MGPSIYRVEAEGDTLYIRAWTEDDAYRALSDFIGPIPRTLLSFTVVDKVPDGEDVITA